MREQKQEKKKLNMVHSLWSTILIAIIIGVLLMGGLVFAKYYANSANKGVASASEYYFSSNLLLDAEDGVKSIYNTSAWDGSSAYQFDVLIQNYRNHLLYNGENLDITYKITFSLNGDDGGSYQVEYDGKSHTLAVGEEYSIEERELLGGTASSDKYSIFITPPADKSGTYVSQGVEVLAEIKSPDYLDNKKIGGILYAGIISTKYLLEAGYEFEDELKNATNWTEVVNNMAGFPYVISYRPGPDDNTAHNIQIQWDSNFLQLDIFDKNNDKVVIDSENGKSNLAITMEPYQTVKLVFYRADGFDMNNITTLQDFRQLILVEDSSQLQEGN